MDDARYSVREFRDADFEDLSRLYGRLYPDQPITAADMRRFSVLAEGSGKRPYRLSVVESGSGTVVACGSLEQYPFNYHPRKHWIGVSVDRDHQRQGIGTELYRLLEAEAHRREAIGLWSGTRMDDDASVRFFHRAGFVEKRRLRQSELAVTPEAVRLLADRTESLRSMGIECTTLAAEGAERDDVRRRYHRLHIVAGEGMPTMGERTPLSFEEFLHLEFSSPKFDPEGTFLAKAGDLFVGVTNVEPDDARPGVLRVGFTGTDPDFRGRGIATELKRRSLEFALARGYSIVATTNDYENPRIWAINEKVGFRTVRSFLDGEKSLSPTG